MNQVILVGTVDKCPEIITLKNSTNPNNIKNKLIKFRLKTQKPFRSKDGEILEDYINIKIWENNIDNIDDILEVDNIIGIKGRINSYSSQSNDELDKKEYYNEVVADKLFFIS